LTTVCLISVPQVGAFIGELDLSPMLNRFDVLDITSEGLPQPENHEGRLDVIMMMNIGWHVGSP